ncbi:MAG TPA: rod-binding protein [Bacteriovoracaceae bacterium]|nr:rod-binding protein [Bacteriovoracaceae bacterium]
MKVTPNAATLPAQRHNPVKPYEEIAEGMEANFTSHMLAEMKKTVPKETPDTPAMDYYNSLLDSERAQLMAQSESGLGIKKVILEQIVPAHMKHYLKNAQPAASQGMTAMAKENIK